LAILLYELLEVDEGRPSRLFGHARPGGKNYGNLLLVTMKAQAAALVEAFHEMEISRPDAAKDVASVLRQCGFDVGHTAVLKWHQDRKKAKGPFLEIYNEILADIHKWQAAFPARTADKNWKDLLEWFAARVMMFTYRA
jgi:hypothetical protein